MKYDLCVIGGGIIGLATALELLSRHNGASLLLLEKENGLARHQTGHNSGVIHAGVYYKPGSLKAQLCRAGEAATKTFCAANGVAYRTPGKLIVATNALEQERLGKLRENAEANQIAFELLGQAELRKREPNITGLAGLLVPQTGIVDYVGMCDAMAARIRAAGGEIRLGASVEAITEQGSHVAVRTREAEHLASKVIVCAGLQADRMVERSGQKQDFQIIPFRGEYYDLAPWRRNVVKHLIYPVPDPNLPFLGIHLTPMIDGGITVGPNAVLGLARERYAKFAPDLRDMARFLAYPGFWRLVAGNMRSGIAEIGDSLLKSSYLEKCRKYCPSLSMDDLVPRTAGIRAQAVDRRGTLIHDFLFLQTERVLHVCNAPSPAATPPSPSPR